MQGDDFAYELSFVPLPHVERTHRIERHGELALALRNEDLDKLDGALLDVRAGGLAMQNPNRPASPTFDSGSSGTLEGSLAEQVAQVITQQVNPAIASHGGAAELAGVEGRDVYLRLLGGCQGCGLVSVTLRQGIEQILRRVIPDLGEIIDVTDHQAGTNPHYESEKK
ncbi:MAG: hypothetical protein GWP04_01405 [Gammaproteobacteria bacterium]|nr:hypothetical protein [Gammaproteobacteria bacterium]